MELTEVLQSRKSIRSFTGEPIPRTVLEKLIFAANASPVGLAKYETLHLTVVKDKALLEELERNTAAAFHAPDRSFLYGAPELIVVSTTQTDNVGYSNAAIVAHDMSLAAVDAGVGVCHIWGCVMALAQSPALTAKLGIPAGFTPACAVAVGMTTQPYAPRQIPTDRIGINEI